MNRRRVRSNSVDADLTDLDSLRHTLRATQSARTELLTLESRSRFNISSSERKLRENMERLFVQEKKLIELRARINQPPLPGQAISKMGELFLLSKAMEKSRREHLKADHVSKQHRSIIDYRQRFEQKRMKAAVEAEAKQIDTQNAVAATRGDRRRAIAETAAIVHQKHRLDAEEVKMTLKEQRRKKESVEGAWLCSQRRRIQDERSRSLSPTMFLKLPPLFDPSDRQPLIFSFADE